MRLLSKLFLISLAVLTLGTSMIAIRETGSHLETVPVPATTKVIRVYADGWDTDLVRFLGVVWIIDIIFFGAIAWIWWD
jgi:hypothetical protein